MRRRALLTTCFSGVVAWNSGFSSRAFFFFFSSGFLLPHLFSETQTAAMVPFEISTPSFWTSHELAALVFRVLQRMLHNCSGSRRGNFYHGRGSARVRKNKMRFYSSRDVQIGKYVDLYVDVYSLIIISA